VAVFLQGGHGDVLIRRVRTVLLTYDAKLGLRAHLVVEVEAKKPQGHRKAAVDLGETQAITAMFDDGTVRMYSGRLIKSIRRYWQKVRSKVKPPTVNHPRKSRQFRRSKGIPAGDPPASPHDGGFRASVLGRVNTIAIGISRGSETRSTTARPWDAEPVSKMDVHLRVSPARG
jgi:hypothetical protein